MKKHVSLLLAIVVMFALIGCGGGKTEGQKPAETKTAKVTGTLYEGAYMNFRHSDDWRISEDTKWKTINCEKGSLLSPTNWVLIKAEKESTRTAEKAVSTFADSYNGTPAEKVTFNNIEYYKTSFEYGGIPQTMMVTMHEDNKITITLQGHGHNEDQSIKDILNSIELKF
jgi:hypothetical protein